MIYFIASVYSGGHFGAKVVNTELLQFKNKTKNDGLVDFKAKARLFSICSRETLRSESSHHRMVITSSLAVRHSAGGCVRVPVDVVLNPCLFRVFDVQGPNH